MTHIKSNDRGFTGLEAAIVLIAFVVVAAVFTYVIFGVKGQDINPPSTRVTEPAAASIQVIGNVYGYGTGTPGSMEINKIQLNIGLAPTASPLDLTKMIIVVSQPDVATITQLTYAGSLSSLAKAKAIGGRQFHFNAHNRWYGQSSRSNEIVRRCQWLDHKRLRLAGD